MRESSSTASLKGTTQFTSS